MHGANASAMRLPTLQMALSQTHTHRQKRVSTYGHELAHTHTGSGSSPWCLFALITGIGWLFTRKQMTEIR